jgi:hypothetical protein
MTAVVVVAALCSAGAAYAEIFLAAAIETTVDGHRSLSDFGQPRSEERPSYVRNSRVYTREFRTHSDVRNGSCGVPVLTSAKVRQAAQTAATIFDSLAVLR